MDRGKLIALLMAMTPEGAEGDSCDVFLRIPIRHISKSAARTGLAIPWAPMGGIGSAD